MKSLNIPNQVSQHLFNQEATIAISYSGGKDSQAMMRALLRTAKDEGWLCKFVVVHADLGRMEWYNTHQFVKDTVAETGLHLEIVRRKKGDLLQEIQERAEKLRGTGKPFFPSAATRYCTSDNKRDPINAYLRTFKGVVISAEGLRSEESTARSKKQCWNDRSLISTKEREAYTWYPILDWTQDDVWMELGTDRAALEFRRRVYAAGFEQEALAGFQAHPAYVYGNERLSCALCVLASENDLRNGAKHNPEIYRELVKLEVATGFTFKNKWSLQQLEA